MRKKLAPDIKRSKIIGIKVNQETRDKLNYLATLNDTPLSTYINHLLQVHITETFKAQKIEWDKLTPEEKGGK